MAGEFSGNKTLMVGVLLLIISFLLSLLLSIYPKYRTLSIPAAILAIFGALLAIRGYILFLKKLKT
jgi:4-hydroxybenzoate polyprenyltransferase